MLMESTKITIKSTTLRQLKICSIISHHFVTESVSIRHCFPEGKKVGRDELRELYPLLRNLECTCRYLLTLGHVPLTTASLANSRARSSSNTRLHRSGGAADCQQRRQTTRTLRLAPGTGPKLHRLDYTTTTTANSTTAGNHRRPRNIHVPKQPTQQGQRGSARHLQQSHHIPPHIERRTSAMRR